MQEPDPTTEAAREVAKFVPLRSISALGDLLQRSDLEPLVLFQHDPYCPISRRAYYELASAHIHAAVVDVAQDGYLSCLIEERTGVRHESPQVLVFRSGKAVWSASHFRITRAAVSRALRQAAPSEVVDDAEADCGAACGGRAKTTTSQNVHSAVRTVWDQQ